MAIQTDQPALRVGIIGGGWPGRRHAEGFRASGAWTIAAVADTDAGRRAALVELVGGATAFASADELLAEPELDAVVVALPTFLHRPVVVAALAAGKHVLCEKPPALNAPEVEAMAAAARQHDRLLGFSLQRRALPSVAAAQALIGQGELGRIFHARAVWTRPWGVPHGLDNWFSDRGKAGGGPLIDLGVHVLDLAWWLMGRPEVISITGVAHNAANDPKRIEDAAFGLLRLADGGSIQLETSWVMQGEGEFRVQLLGSQAGMVIDQETLTMTRVDATGSQSTRPALPGGWPETLMLPFVSQASNLAAAIRGEAVLLTPAADGLMLMRLIDGFYRSATERREVPIEMPKEVQPPAGAPR